MFYHYKVKEYDRFSCADNIKSAENSYYSITKLCEYEMFLHSKYKKELLDIVTYFISAMEYFEYWATINKSLPIRLTLARNTPYFHILNRLVNDKDTNVLRAIARNVNCPNSILEKLSIHENRSVRGN